LGGQLIRSATSAALNFGESQGAESKKDQIHKLGIVLKELKESRVAFKILAHIKYGSNEKRENLLKECSELIAIVATIIRNKKTTN
jgi:four helix bundle protein